MSQSPKRPRSVNSHIAASTGAIALATAVSRILGFVRDLLVAGLFGTLPQAQAFVVAFRLPNLLRDLVAEGAVSSAFVPVLSAYRAKGDMTQFWRVSHSLLTRMVLFLCALGLIGALAAPWVVRLIAPGFAADPEKFALTVRLTRMLFPFITLVGLWAYFMGLLNSLRHFTMPALGPAILNVAMIIACVWFVPRVSPGVVALAISVLIGGFIQLAIQVPVAVRLGFRWRWEWRSEATGEMMRLLGPRMLGASVYQANVLVHTALASLGTIVGEGAVAALYFANRLVQLPLAVFGTASAQASLPSLAEQAAHKDFEAFRSTLLSVIRMVGFVMLPASVGLMVLAVPIVSTLFERGAFDQRATSMTSQALIWYSMGAGAYAVSKVLTGAFYAMQDTWTPVKLTIEAVAVNIFLSLALMWPMQLGGLALAASVSNVLNAYHLLRRMERRLQASLVQPLGAPLVRMAGASAVMGIGCWLLWNEAIRWVAPVVALLPVIAGGIILYGAGCRLFGVGELATAQRWLIKLLKIQSSSDE